MKLHYYQILYHAATDWYSEKSFQTKEQAEEIAKLSFNYFRLDSYEIVSCTLDLVEDYEKYKNDFLKFLKK